MNLTKTDLPKSRVKLTITIEAAEFGQFVEQAVTKLSREASLPGFRKGHIPAAMIREKFGEAAIAAEAADLAVPKLLARAIVEQKIQPIERPEVSLESLEPFCFSAEFTVLPAVRLGQWEKVEIKPAATVIAPAEIEEVVEKLRERFQTRKAVERPAQTGDFVEVDFAGHTPDGVPLDGTVSKLHPLILGSGSFIPGFEEAIVGMAKGEEKSFPLTFPTEYHAKHLAGKEVVFTVTLHNVFEHEKPPVDETLTEQVFGQKMTVAEFEAKIENILREKAEADDRNRREGELIAAWTKDASVDLPELLIEEELERIRKGIVEDVQKSGASWEQFLEHVKKTPEEFLAEMRPRAEETVKQRLTLQEVLKSAAIEVTAEEIDAAIAEHNEHTGHHHGVADPDYREDTARRLQVQKLFDRFLGAAPQTSEPA